MQKRRTIQELKELQESEDRIEFKAAEQGNFSYNGSGKDKPAARRKCILGYVVAFCNEGGGSLVLGMGIAIHIEYLAQHRIKEKYTNLKAVSIGIWEYAPISMRARDFAT